MKLVSVVCLRCEEIYGPLLLATSHSWLYTFLWSPLFESRRSLIILMFLDELCFIVVVIAMVLELQQPVIGSIYFYGAEGDFTFCFSLSNDFEFASY